MKRIAIVSFSDGRPRVHETLREHIQARADKIADALSGTGEVAIACMPDIVCDNEKAALAARQVLAADVDACIFNVCVFAFPNFSAITRRLLQGLPVLAISPKNGTLPGLGGLQAAVNAIHQAGGQCEKVWGNIEDARTLEDVLCFLRAAQAATRLRGQVMGLLGGRSIGMMSGTADPDVWMQHFGVDVDHFDQLEILRRAELIPPAEAARGIRWLLENGAKIAYDEDKVTDESLGLQVRCYMALKAIAAEKKLDFLAVKCHYEMSEYYVAQCLSAALFNDPYDWDGPKEPMVYACEADADAALTMQILKLATGKPTLFMDFRHYLEEEGVFVFCNCGACATWYAQRSDMPGENLRHVTLCPLIPKYAGKGCHVQYMAAAGEMTFARLSRVMGKYKMQAFNGRLEELPPETMELTSPSWPHAYTRVQSDPYALVQRFESNHIHAVEGDHMQTLRQFCLLKDIPLEEL